VESSILSAMVYKRDAYDLLQDILDAEDFTVYGKALYKLIRTYYESDSTAKDVDLSLLSARAARDYPRHVENISAVISTLLPVSVPNVLAEYVDVKIHALSHRLSGLLAEGVHSKDTDELLYRIVELKEFGEKALGDGENDQEINSLSVEDVFSSLREENLIKLFPESLCEGMGGGVPRPCHIVVFARPNSGKSLFGISLESDFLRQGLRALYICNEDAAPTILGRIINNLSGMTKHEVLSNMEEAQERAVDSGYNNLYFLDKASCSLSYIKKKVKKIRPDVIVVDQLRNLEDTNNKRSRVDSLDYIARSVRNIGKDYGCVTVSITQAGEPAHNKLVLDMEDVDGSKTGIQASCEYMIGIGVNDSFKEQNRRMISIPKSKNPDATSHFPVRINPYLSRIYDI